MTNQEFVSVSANCLNAINDSILLHINIRCNLLHQNTLFKREQIDIINTLLSEYDYINFVEI